LIAATVRSEFRNRIKSRRQKNKERSQWYKLKLTKRSKVIEAASVKVQFCKQGEKIYNTNSKKLFEEKIKLKYYKSKK